MRRYNFQVCLLGEGRVGKTCLLIRYIENKFATAVQSTIEATQCQKRLRIREHPVVLDIWDTAGQERFHGLAPIYYRKSQGAIVVYDICDRESFSKAHTWVAELRKIVGNQIVLVLVGNKTDLSRKHRQVDLQTAEEYAKSVDAMHFVVSARFGTNVNNAFFHLAEGMMDKFGPSQRKNLVVESPLLAQPNSSTSLLCCNIL
uniref:Ras-related protein Rab-21 n=1 Tax=Hirondellea gigas TaxID=1518452 RepID=A0A6A7G9S8_9CRUS